MLRLLQAVQLQAAVAVHLVLLLVLLGLLVGQEALLLVVVALGASLAAGLWLQVQPCRAVLLLLLH